MNRGGHDFSRALNDQHADDDELLSDLGGGTLPIVKQEMKPTFLPFQPHIPLPVSDQTVLNEDDYDSDLDDMHYLRDLRGPQYDQNHAHNPNMQQTYNSHFEESKPAATDSKKKREPMGEREMRLRR